MGNEKSIPIKCSMGDEIIYITDNWIQRDATINEGSTAVNIFETSISNKNLTDELLYKFSKNLMIHRHPHILRYISSWNKNGKFYVATESAKPLSQVLESQTPMQLCVGLYNILKVIIFLHEKALSSHNNICKDVIYVTSDGTWKLARMECLCRFCDLTSNYLAKISAHRYKRAINPQEEHAISNAPHNIDKYAFSILVDEILDGKVNDEIPTVIEFKEYCKNRLLNSQNGSTEVNLTQLMSHPFFTHRFVAIYTFLVELPLKTEMEKTDFFKTLADELILFPEELIAKQLIALLLSRLVVLNKTAQSCLLPKILQLKDDKHPESLFTKNVATKYVAPCVLNIFGVRDLHIRIILLRYFSEICSLFSHQQLSKMILPELLAGIKDTNDELVEVTLHAVASLVPILGASTVIGKCRAKIFSDGCPINYDAEKVNKCDLPCIAALHESEKSISLIERPSPDGGEDIADNNTNIDEDESECWSDWENHNGPSELKVKAEDAAEENSIFENSSNDGTNEVQNEVETRYDEKILDLKHNQSGNKLNNDDIDKLFKDMEPVISKAQIYTVTNESSKFKAKNITDDSSFEGWEENINFEDNSSGEIN